ncbi:unnamed protein product [Effrenium voratum]|nr:unnamed protein product [Effrenium voratum]
MTPTEGVDKLRQILRMVDGTLDVSQFGTHSCKATVLSWLAKSGASQQIQRRAGYHAKASELNPMEYSQDAQSEVLNRISSICIAVRFGRFQPDNNRSQRWVGCQNLEEAVAMDASFGTSVGTKGAPSGEDECRFVEPTPCDAASQDAEDLDSQHDSGSGHDSTSSTSSSVDGSESESEDEKRQAVEHVQEMAKGVNEHLTTDFDLFNHVKRRTLHRSARTNVDPEDGEARTFVCGRLVTRMFEQVSMSELPAFNPDKCKQCFSKGSILS